MREARLNELRSLHEEHGDGVGAVDAQDGFADELAATQDTDLAAGAAFVRERDGVGDDQFASIFLWSDLGGWIIFVLQAIAAIWLIGRAINIAYSLKKVSTSGEYFGGALY